MVHTMVRRPPTRSTIAIVIGLLVAFVVWTWLTFSWPPLAALDQRWLAPTIDIASPTAQLVSAWALLTWPGLVYLALAGLALWAYRHRLRQLAIALILIIPLGWGASDVELGRADPIASPSGGKAVQARLRRIQPLVELRIPFEVTRVELDAIDRGARDPDLDSVTAAAREIAIAEDRAIFHGYAAARISGICEAQAGTAVPLGASRYGTPARRRWWAAIAPGIFRQAWRCATSKPPACSDK